MAGYSGTPLIQKLGIKSGFTVAFVNAPDGYVESLALPDDCATATLKDGKCDLVQCFTRSREELGGSFSTLITSTKTNGSVWISWPKKSSGVETDLNENVVRDIGLAAGVVDVKVCAVDDVWSGLKFVRRLKDR